MSTNGVYGQMQSWLNGHGKNVSDFSSKMDEFEKQFYEIFQQYQEKLTNKEYNELNEKFADLQMNYLEAELNYLKQEKEVGRSFNFMEGDYDITDGQTFIPAYIEQTGKLAQGDMDSWETDGEDGISLEEYKSSQLGSADASQLGEEGYNAAVSYAEEVFNTIDIDGDGIIEKNELQGFYAAMDNVDGSVDGKISVDSLGVDYTSEKFRKNIEEFQQYLQ